MRLENLDLNLLILLEALYEESGVSAAGARLGLSQSATSSALARLRAYFDDDLFVYSRRRFEATALAHEMREPVLQILSDIRASVIRPQQADISSFAMTFRIAVADDIIETRLGPAMHRLMAIAPRLTFRIQPLQGDLAELLDRNQTDLVIAHKTSLSARLPLEDIATDCYRVVGCPRNHHLQGAAIDPDYFATADYVTIGFIRRGMARIDELLIEQGLPSRRLVIHVPTFANIPGFLANTEQLAIVPGDYATLLERRGLARALPLPVDLPPFTIAAQWRASNAGAVVQNELIRLMRAPVE